MSEWRRSDYQEGESFAAATPPLEWGLEWDDAALPQPLSDHREVIQRKSSPDEPKFIRGPDFNLWRDEVSYGTDGLSRERQGARENHAWLMLDRPRSSGQVCLWMQLKTFSL
jgi:hypothetical protein